MVAPLAGVRVVELTTMITGPLAGMLLADLGASIIKVENPDGGDPFRYFRGDLYGGHFIAYNRNKRSLTLDLRSADGKAIFRKLVATADVLIDNFRPGVLDRLGFASDVLSELNPGLIHCSLTGFGRDGPYRDRPCYDAVAQSLSGVLNQFLDPDLPQPAGPTIADNITGFYAAYGIMGALYERGRTGKGRRVETSMIEATIAFAPDAFINNKRYGIPVGPLTRVGASQSYAFRCQDGRLIAIHLSSQLKFWNGLLAALERPDISTDARFNTRELRIANYVALRDELAKTFAARPRQDWAQRLEAHDVPYAPVYGVDEVIDDPQVRHLGMFYQVTHPQQGEVWGVCPPLWIDGSRPGQMTAPPALGEHTDAVLADLGFAGEDVARFKAAKVV
jgi:crotonobetainyl-CoA:carnitine CoA-transferase CaiB-like acyl-CoA transferase